MTRTSIRIAAYVAFAGLVAAATACVGMWYVVTDSRAELQEKQQQAAYLEARETSLIQLERELAATKAEREAMRALLLEPEFVVDFLELVETLGASYGADVTTASIEVVEELPLLDTLKIDIKATGAQAGVVRVLELLETLPYVSEVTNASMSATPGGEASWEGDFTLIIAKHKEL